MLNSHVVEAETTLLEVLVLMYPESSKGKLRQMLTDERVGVDGEVVVKAKQVVSVGATVEVNPRMQGRRFVKRGVRAVELLHIDNSIIVVNKPSGLLSVAPQGGGAQTLHSHCVDFLKAKDRRNWAFIVHRLDRETSGVMVLARDKEAKSLIQSQFKDRVAERVYHALVEGVVKREGGTEIHHLVENDAGFVRPVSAEREDAREAITHWKRVGSGKDRTLLKVDIETGRRHQIRIALAEMGHPVVGDRTRGSRGVGMKRLGLHASSLAFHHPDGGEWVEFEAALPEDFVRNVTMKN